MTLAGDSGLTALLRRDRLVVSAALAVVALLAWAYVVWLALAMSMSMPADVPNGAPAAAMDDMAGMDMGPAKPTYGEPDSVAGAMDAAAAPAFRAWTAAEFAFVFAMWAVMMIGMMTPSVAPMVLLYASVGRKAAQGGAPFASTGWFFAGYLSAWIGFSAIATLAQWGLIQAALLSPMMTTTSTLLGAVILIASGAYQWTRLKDTCLRSCQAPLGFLMAHGGFRSEPLGALRLGFQHGLYCLGCCFALMALLFVGGVMNVLWIAGLSILVLLEKVTPAGRLISRAAGILIGAAGVWLLASAIWPA